jgi:hypothetical protein
VRRFSAKDVGEIVPTCFLLWIAHGLRSSLNTLFLPAAGQLDAGPNFVWYETRSIRRPAGTGKVDDDWSDRFPELSVNGPA